MVLRAICTTYVHIYFLQYWLVNLIMKLVKNEKRLRPQNVIKLAAFSNRIPITISITIIFKCYFCKCVICSVTCSKISRKHVGITFLSRALMWILGQSLRRSTVLRLWRASHSLMLSIDAKRWNHREIDYFWTLKKGWWRQPVVEVPPYSDWGLFWLLIRSKRLHLTDLTKPPGLHGKIVVFVEQEFWKLSLK